MPKKSDELTAIRKTADKAAIKSFVDRLWKFHAQHRRNNMPWRNTKDPYRILLSELMLQQTQVSRVLQKYNEFLINFPDLESVHRANMADILKVWKGLGYNRRAYFIKKIAAALASSASPFRFPKTYEELIKLPGIGQSTGGALVAFAFADKTGERIPFIETNIRVVFIHEFFINKIASKQKDAAKTIDDKEIRAKLEQCLALVKPADIREFYYALYDYGTHLKASLGKERTTIHKRSAHYSKQSAFKGSVREMRAKILAEVVKNNNGANIGGGEDARPKSGIAKGRLKSIVAPLAEDSERFETALQRLIKDNSVAISRKSDIIDLC